MKLRVLVDNYTYIDQYYLGEPAVSYYLEIDDRRILFDTGYSDIFLSNAKKMGIDLSRLTHVVLSHGHNDHTHGLYYLSQAVDLSKVELIAHPDCFLPKRDEEEYIGAPFSMKEMQSHMLFHPKDEPFAISEHCLFLGEIPRRNDFEAKHSIGELEKDGIWQPDHVLDDSALVCQTGEGLFLITGCSHSGICNIIDYAMEVCKEQRIAGILGGFHMFQAGSRLEQTIAYMQKQQIHQLYPCHCVSLAAKASMMQNLPVQEAGVGLQIEIGRE